MFLTAWLGHTDRSRVIAQCIHAAIDALNWTQDYVADLMGLDRADFANQLAGRKPLNVWRLANLPDEFQIEYDKRRIGLRGGVVLEADEVAFVRGAAMLGHKRMAPFTRPAMLPIEQERAS